MTIKEYQKIRKEKEAAAERLIKKMETKTAPDFRIPDRITCYVNHGFGGYFFAEWEIQKEYGIFPKSIEPWIPDIKNEIHPEKLKRFVMYCLEENKEENIELIRWIKKEN